VDFLADNVPELLSECARRHLIMLRFDYVYVLFMIHGVFLHDAEWMRRLTAYSDGYTGNRRPDGAHFRSQYFVKESWPELVEASRSCMKLFRVVNQTDMALIWYDMLKFSRED
jgi:hypothetical protein